MTFAAAWEDYGFRKPPTDKQRDALEHVIEVRPARAAQWVYEAPPGLKPYDVIGWVLDRHRASSA
jgi:hypothetical protein